MIRFDHHLSGIAVAALACSALSWSTGCATGGAFPASALQLIQAAATSGDAGMGPRFTILTVDGASIAVDLDERALRERYPQLLSLVGLAPASVSASPAADVASDPSTIDVRGMRIVPFSGIR